MRSPEELVHELDREAGQLSMVAIVVAFDDTSRFVFHDEQAETVLTNLRAMIEAGGEPFGLLGYTANENEAQVASFVYEEYKNTVWAAPLMEELANNMAATLRGYQTRTGSA